jgi:hypothetical protein
MRFACWARLRHRESWIEPAPCIAESGRAHPLAARGGGDALLATETPRRGFGWALASNLCTHSCGKPWNLLLCGIFILPSPTLGVPTQSSTNTGVVSTLSANFPNPASIFFWLWKRCRSVTRASLYCRNLRCVVGYQYTVSLLNVWGVVFS